MGVDGAAGRLVEFGERERRAQFEAARRLAALRRRWRSGTLLRQAPGWRSRASAAFRRGRDAVRRRMCDGRSVRTSPALRRGRRVARSTSPARASASASAILRSPSNRTFCSRRSSAPRRMSSSPPLGAPLSALARPSRKSRVRSPHRQIMLARESGEFEPRSARRARRSPRISSNTASVHSPVCVRADMGEARDPRLGVVERGKPRARRRPAATTQARGKASPRRRRPVRSERPDRRRARVEQGERAFQMIARFDDTLRRTNASILPSGERLPASGESGLASTSLKKAAECSLIAGSSPRATLPAHRP